MENKCIGFCFQLNKMSTISHEEFKDWNWLPVMEIKYQDIKENRQLKYF